MTPFLALFAGLLRHRWLILACALAGLATVMGVTLARPLSYSSTVSFVPQARRVSSGVSGIAAQFGIDLGGTDAGQSPQFYVDLLTSRGLLRDLVDHVYTFTADGRRVSGSLTDLMRAEGPTPALRREVAMSRLRERVRVTTSAKTDVVLFTVKTDFAELSQLVAAQAIELLDRFNTQTRQSQARAEREFTERRLQDARAGLARAEDRLRAFSEANRAYAEAPALLLERVRLQRDLDTQQRLYNAFSDAYEKARVDEIRDTPVITLVAKPEVPVGPDGRGLLLRAALGLIGGMILGVLIAAARTAWGVSRRRYADSHADFDAVAHEAWAEVQRPVRAAGRALAPRRVGP